MRHDALSGYLSRHPTPWRLVQETFYPDRIKEPDDIFDELKILDAYAPASQVIVDANGNDVLRSADQEGHISWFEGDVRALIAFVNHVGEG